MRRRNIDDVDLRIVDQRRRAVMHRGDAVLTGEGLRLAAVAGSHRDSSLRGVRMECSHEPPSDPCSDDAPAQRRNRVGRKQTWGGQDR
jgi:hypothetical protein